jgi:hypothetical protein
MAAGERLTNNMRRGRSSMRVVARAAFRLIGDVGGESVSETTHRKERP